MSIHSFLNKIKKSDIYTSKWIVLFIDVTIILQTFFLAYLIRFNFSLNFDGHHFIYQMPLIALFALISILLVGSHKGIIRHTGINDAVRVFYATALFTMITTIMVFIIRKINIFTGFSIPLSIIAIHFLLSVVALIASRFIFRRIYERLFLPHKNQKNILLYGAGFSGMTTYATITNDTSNKYNVIGFIDDNPSKQNKTYNGKKIYALKNINENFIRKNDIKEVIISIQNITPLNLLKITDSIVALSLKAKIIPPIEKWMNGDLKIKQIKEVKIEDLLGRAPIKVENPILKKEFNQKTILITGAAGSIGSEIAKQVSKYNYKHLIILDQAESPLYDLQQDFKRNNIPYFSTIIADIRNENRLKQVFSDYNIDIIFHAAAYKHVPLMENNPYEAVKVNIGGTKSLMDLAAKNKVEKFVMISTDKAVNPTNVMGATKRVAEMYAKCLQENSSTKFIITRFGNVLGSNGSVIPLFKKQIKNGGPLTVTHQDITRYFMTIPEACQLVLEAGAMGNGGEIYVFDMGESVKIIDVAKKMIHLSGFKYPNDIDIKIVGLRPGEKLYEELLSDKENTQPTYHNKIMIAKVKNFNCSIIATEIEKIITLKNKSNLEIVKQLKKIVPEYKSNNSEYEKLD